MGTIRSLESTTSSEFKTLRLYEIREAHATYCWYDSCGVPGKNVSKNGLIFVTNTSLVKYRMLLIISEYSAGIGDSGREFHTVDADVYEIIDDVVGVGDDGNEMFDDVCGYVMEEEEELDGRGMNTELSNRDSEISVFIVWFRGCIVCFESRRRDGGEMWYMVFWLKKLEV